MIHFGFFIALALTFALLSIVFIGLWVYKDAKQRELQAGLWTLLVVCIGNPIGLILYLLIGRNQKHAICTQCGSTPNSQNSICASSGEMLPLSHSATKLHKSLLFSCIACVVAFFICLSMALYAYTTADGFSFRWQVAAYRYYSSNNYIKNENQRSAKNTWTISYNDASPGYVFKQTYRAVEKPATLSVKVEGNGTLQLLVTQNESAINEIIGEGSFSYDMTNFTIGEIDVSLINLDASNVSVELIILS